MTRWNLLPHILHAPEVGGRVGAPRQGRVHLQHHVLMRAGAHVHNQILAAGVGDADIEIYLLPNEGFREGIDDLDLGLFCGKRADEQTDADQGRHHRQETG